VRGRNIKLAAPGEIPVGQICYVPRDRFSDGGNAHDRCEGEHKIIDREDAQKSPDVERPENRLPRCPVLLGGRTCVEQNARYEKAADDEEQQDPMVPAKA
jgi:hypothetical protein